MKKTLLIIILFVFSWIQPVLAEEVNELHWPKDSLIFVKFMLSASGETDAEKIQAFNDAYTFLSEYWSKNSGEVTPGSLTEYINATDGDKELFLDLERELRSYREGEFTHFRVKAATNPEVQSDIEMYNQRQGELAKSYFDQAITQAKIQNGNPKFALAYIFLQTLISDWGTFHKKTPELLKKHPLASIDNSTKLQIANAFSGLFETVSQEIRNLGKKVGSGMTTPGKPEVKRSVEILFEEYFKNETDDAIKNMISGLLDHPGETDNMKRMGTVLQFAAPNLLKLLQLIARQEGISPQAIKVLSKLEDEVQGAAFYAIQKLIEADLDKMKAQGIHIDMEKIDKKALKAATIGQIHLGEIRLDIPQEAIVYDEDTGVLGPKNLEGDMTVVFRFTKPGSQKRSKEGRDIMKLVAQAMDSDPILTSAAVPKATPLVEALYTGIVNDMDLPGTERRHRAGIEKYTSEEIVELEDGTKARLVFKVPHLFYVGENFSIMEAVSGNKLNDVYDVKPQIAQSIFKRMSFKWFYEAYFQSGFFHGDLHPGNFMAKAVKDSKISIKKHFWTNSNDVAIPTYVINVLDFGMGGVAEFKLRKGVFGMMVAAMAFDSELLAQIAWAEHEPSLSEVQTKEEFRKRFFKSIESADKQSQDEKLKMKMYINAVNESGISFDPILAGLMRGTVIKNLLSSTVKMPTTFQGFIGNVIREKPMVLKNLLFSDKLLRSEAKWVGINKLVRKTTYQLKCWMTLSSEDE